MRKTEIKWQTKCLDTNIFKKKSQEREFAFLNSFSSK